MFGGEIVKIFGSRQFPRQGPKQSWTWKICHQPFFFAKSLDMSCLMEKL